ncbi:MAG: AmpG family muropeptide MFS transporter [Gemmatimonadota bacterium]
MGVSYSPIKLFGQPKMAALLVLGFASGLPYFLTSRTLQAWMTTSGVDLATIGMFSLVALPYSLKFLWAPLLDRYIPPFLGRRRGWIFILQLVLMIAIGAMMFRNPTRSIQLIAINALVIAFVSATYDIAFDAYRTDVLEHREMGAGASMGVLGYRLALILTGSLALILADSIPWPMVYAIMAGTLLLPMIATFRAPEPVLKDKGPQSLRDAVILPFGEFFQRVGPARAFAILGFIVLYKLSDYLAAAMATPFLLEIGFTQTQIGAIQGGIGMVTTIVGTLAGGLVVARLGINRSLWVFGLLQAASNLMYYLLAVVGQNTALLTTAMIVENFCTGLVTAGFVAFLMSLCSVRFSATQYALLSSLMSFSRDLLTSRSGEIAESTGWPSYFLITLAAGVPGLLLLPIFAPWNKDQPLGAAEHTGAVTNADGDQETPRAGTEVR